MLYVQATVSSSQIYTVNCQRYESDRERERKKQKEKYFFCFVVFLPPFFSSSSMLGSHSHSPAHRKQEMCNPNVQFTHSLVLAFLSHSCVFGVALRRMESSLVCILSSLKSLREIFILFTFFRFVVWFLRCASCSYLPFSIQYFLLLCIRCGGCRAPTMDVDTRVPISHNLYVSFQQIK